MNLKEFAKLFDDDMYICGGYVRDKYLNKPSNDIDICSKYTPEEIIDICNKENISFFKSERGIAHGVVSIHLDEGIIEHCTFRKDVKCDGRHSEISYSDSLIEDAYRRDFTMNSMYISIKTDEMIDPFNGRLSLFLNEIEFVGDPLERIREDHLRMLRYFRFANRFNLSLKKIDLITIYENRFLLEKVSKERIRKEFDKMLKDGLNYDILEEIVKIFGDINNTFLRVLLKMYECPSNNPYHSKKNVLEHCHHVYIKSKERVDAV